MRFGHRFESRYYQRSTLNDGLLVAWPLDEASGTRYPDYGGTEFNLTDVDTVGTADAPTGIGGLCANFNGSTEYLYCNDPFSPPSAMSMSLWMRPTSVTGGAARIALSQDRNTVGIDRAWLLFIASATGLLTFVASADGSTVTTATASGALSANAWVMATAVWDGSTITVYKNATAGTPAAFTGPLWNSAEPIRVGANSVSGTPSNFFPGRIAQPVILDRAFTSAEIIYLYNSGNGRPLSDWLA